ncbi:MAG: nucleotidyl transferase AbiEii/AbiGii toxin family protein [Thermodesulfovibrionales bacterium]
MFEELLSRLGRSLEDKEIPYMIIGGQAVLLYGEPRLTRDIDITLGISTDRLKDIIQIIEDIPLKILPEDVYEFVGKTMVLPAFHEDTGIRVDFIFSFTPYEQEAIQRARVVLIKGTDVKFASPEDVIIHKIFAGRPRDIEDVRGIILKNPKLDLRYIEGWLKEFENSVEGGDFLQVFKEILKNVKG